MSRFFRRIEFLNLLIAVFRSPSKVDWNGIHDYFHAKDFGSVTCVPLTKYSTMFRSRPRTLSDINGLGAEVLSGVFAIVKKVEPLRQWFYILKRRSS
jgi:hypothetical protein